MKTVILPRDAVYSGNLILVNNNNPIKKDVCEKSLIPLANMNSITLMDRQSARLLDKLIDELGAQNLILAVSGWRSKLEQTRLFEESLSQNGEEFTYKYVAVPGCSEHQTGLAVDLSENIPNIDLICPSFPNEGIFKKFREKAPIYGYVERYPKGRENITGIGWEPWHFRYVGFPHSLIMYENNLTLEEYHELLKEHKYEFESLIYSINGRRIEISYLAAKESGKTLLEIDDDVLFSVSGSNTDGFIITIWR